MEYSREAIHLLELPQIANLRQDKRRSEILDLPQPVNTSPSSAWNEVENSCKLVMLSMGYQDLGLLQELEHDKQSWDSEGYAPYNSRMLRGLNGGKLWLIEKRLIALERIFGKRWHMMD